MQPEINPSLPTDLSERLQQAGVQDQASFDALLARDPALRREVQMALQQWALDQFLEIPDSETLLAWVQRFPFLIDPGFTKAVEDLIHRTEASGDAIRVRALRQRLNALASVRAQIGGRYEEMGASPLVQALMAFLAAEDEEAAHRVFVCHRVLLQSDEALQTLTYGFGSDDPASWQRVQERLQLLNTLRRQPGPEASAGGEERAPAEADIRQQLAARQALLRGLESEIILATGRERAALAVHIEQEQAAIAGLMQQLDDLA